MNTFFTVNPENGTQLKDYTYFPSDSVLGSVKKAHEDYQIWRKTKFHERASILKKLAHDLRNAKTSLSLMMQNEMGKSQAEGEAEVEKSAQTCEYYAERGEEFLQDLVVNKSPYERAFVSYQPLGVIFSVMPWNFPVWQVLRFAAPAIMAGNVILLKHSDLTTGTADLIDQIFTKLTPEIKLLRHILVDHEMAAQIIAQPEVRGVTFTGSTRGGREVAEIAGKNLKKIVLELGGSDPYIVLADADIPLAAKVCAAARAVNAGQSCVAAKRFIVEEAVYSEFFGEFKKQFESQKLSPLAAKKFQKELQIQVDKLIHMGAKLFLGGKIPEGEGAYYPPTILVVEKGGLDPAIHEEEFFGPVALIFKASNVEECIKMANLSPFGLGAALFSKDTEAATERARQEIEAGFVAINAAVKSHPSLPFGGVKNSGYGRELGVFGLHEFVNVKTIGVVRG